jgi:hypothetical protein
MKQSSLCLLLTVLAAYPLRGQVSPITPKHARDSVAAEDRPSPEERHARQLNLDSLAVGRHRWKISHVQAYRLQAHMECFCASHDTAEHFSIVTVQNGAIISRLPGRKITGAVPTTTTIDSLFAFVARDIREPGRRVRQLQLDPLWGFPRDYAAITENISETRFRIQVDSFEVILPASASTRRPGAP